MFYWLILWSFTPICEYFVFLTIRIVISYLILDGNIILKLYFEFDFQVSCHVHNSLLRKIFEAGVQKSRSSRLKLFNKKMFLAISQNSQENTCAKVYFLNTFSETCAGVFMFSYCSAFSSNFLAPSFIRAIR